MVPLLWGHHTHPEETIGVGYSSLLDDLEFLEFLDLFASDENRVIIATTDLFSAVLGMRSKKCIVTFFLVDLLFLQHCPNSTKSVSTPDQYSMSKKSLGIFATQGSGMSILSTIGPSI